jgi:hypothetical protein
MSQAMAALDADIDKQRTKELLESHAAVRKLSLKYIRHVLIPLNLM